MASLPPQRPASQRRASPPPESASQQPVARTDSFSAHSVDSQTLLLNPPQSQATQPTDPTHIEEATQNAAPPEEYELKRCWICFNDESEDDETTSEWRSPCTCTLVAHEKCLLDWIADMEAPNSRRRAGKRASKVQCPQCKTEIRIQRPRSVVVEAVRTAERLTSFLVIPGLAFVTATAACSALSLAGTHTIYQIFGTEDALQILGPLYELPDPRMVTPMTRFLKHLRHHWRLDIGLPLIPTVLIASRTTFADSFLPFLPLIFFVSSGSPGDEMLQLQWPPSAAFSFAALPYLRGFYNAFYERVCLPREQQWLKEIQPRADTDDEGDANVNNNNNEDVQEIQIEVDLDLFDDWNNNGDGNNHEALDNDPVPAPREPGRPADAPPAAVVADPPPRRRIRRDRTVSAGSIIDTILGSLLFPSIAAAMGEILNRTLPKSWVTPPKGAVATSWLGGWVATGGRPGATGKPTGFLQTRWGRSIVGGCMFVGLKDMVLLYVRWRVAQNHRKRRIMDCDPELKKAKRGTSTTS